MNFLLWNRLPNIGMGSKDLRSGFFFVFWNWNKATVCTRRHYRLYSLYFQWEIPCVEGISSPDSSCVWLETVFLTAAGSEDEPLLQGHMPGAVLHCGHPQAGQLGGTSTVLSWWAVISWRTLGRQCQALQSDHLTALSISIMILKAATVP